jgi:hypothetical protein
VKWQLQWQQVQRGVLSYAVVQDDRPIELPSGLIGADNYFQRLS